MKKFLLPDPDLFQSDDKEVVPLMKFYDWVLRNCNPAVGPLSKDGELSDLLKHLDISKVIIHDDYDKKLRKITKKFIMKKYKAYAKRAEREVSWHFLDIGPSTKEVEGKHKDYVIIEDGFLDRLKDRGKND